MSKVMNKVIYKAGDFGKFLLEEGMESLFYGLHIVSSSLSDKFLSQMPLEEHYYRMNMRRRFLRLYRKGYISKIGKGKDSLYNFSKKSKFLFLSDYLGRKAKAFKKGWDEKWRLVIYDVPEKKKTDRELLRRHLVNLGFGKVQDSCWVSCYDFSSELYSFSKEKGLRDYLCIYEGRFFAGQDPDRLVENAWGLNKLHSQYKELISKVKERIREVKTENVLFEDCYKSYHSLFSSYKSLLVTDPFLPKEFSPLWKVREQAEADISKLFKLALKQADLKF